MSARLLLAQTDDKHRVELSIPGYMFSLLFESLLKNHGLAVRAELKELADKASVVPLNDLTRDKQITLGGIVEKDGYSILNAANESNVPVLTAALARLMVSLTDRGVVLEENAVMVALAIADESKDDANQWGSDGAINAAMVKLDNESRRMGYFIGGTTMQ